MTDFLEYCNEQMSIVDTQAKLAQLPEILSENNHTMALARHGRPVLAYCRGSCSNQSWRPWKSCQIRS